MKGHLIFGQRPAEAFFENEKKADEIFLLKGRKDKKIISYIKTQSSRIKECSRDFLDKLCEGGNHQGIAIRAQNPFSVLEIDPWIRRWKSQTPRQTAVVCEGISDPHNLGAIFRTCEAAGIHSVLITQRESAPLTSTVIKSSAGAIFRLSIGVIGRLANSMEKLKKEGFWIYGTVAPNENRAIDYHQSNWNGPVLLILGNEGKGISHLVKKKCDHLVTIPLPGKTASLNVSVAAGILIFKAKEKRPSTQ